MSQWNFDSELIRRSIEAGVDRGLRAITVRLGEEVKRMLSRPGRGRIYIRHEHKGGKRRLSAKAFRAARRAGVNPRFFKHGGGVGAFLTRQQFAQLLRERRSSGKGHGNVRTMGFHRASAPFEPPAKDTGTLSRSWQTSFAVPIPSKTPGRRVMRVSSALRYARPLEFGHGRTLPRPYIRPSAAKVQKIAQPIMDGFVAAAVRGLRK